MKQEEKIGFMNDAIEASIFSGDPHKQVGAVVVYKFKNKYQLLNFGYNHLTTPFLREGYKDENDKTRPEVIHAEAHALRILFRCRPKNCELFSTLSPCMECAKLIYLSGIKKIYFKELWKDKKPLKFLEKNGISYEQIE